MILRSTCLAIVLVAGCQTSGSGGAGAHGATSSSVTTAPSGSAPTAPTGVAQPQTKARTARTGAPPGEPGVLKLASGATLAMPAGATSSPMNKAAKRLPGVVRIAHKYQLGNDKRLLLVNEMDPEGLDCKGVLDRELQRANKAKTDTDEQRRAMRKMKGITEIKIGNHRALYAVSQNRLPAPGTAAADTSKPMLGIATLIMCRDKDYVVMMHAADQSALPEDTKKMLVAIASSYKPAG